MDIAASYLATYFNRKPMAIVHQTTSQNRGKRDGGLDNSDGKQLRELVGLATCVCHNQKKKKEKHTFKSVFCVFLYKGL